jgi:hypothetical protein
MKKHCYNSLTDFYNNVKNVVGSTDYDDYSKHDDSKWMGLSLANIHKYKFSYPMGVEKLAHFKDVELEKDVNEKFYNQFDGYDIDIDRMMENLDFLIDNRKKRKLPKTVDIYIQIGEGCTIGYDKLLCKTYAAVKIIDKLESHGVRCAVYACNAFLTISKRNDKGQLGYLEVCVKNYADPINLGSLCTAISPWIFRHYFLLHTIGHFPNVDVIGGASYTMSMPEDITGIVIKSGQCHEVEAANKFINSIKIA